MRWDPIAEMHSASADRTPDERQSAVLRAILVANAKLRPYISLMTTTKRKSPPKKTASSKSKKPRPARKSTAAKPAADNMAEQALKFVDEAAALLRHGIRKGAKTTSQSRAAAKTKAHHLLGRASKSLSQAIEGGATALQKILKKM